MQRLISALVGAFIIVIAAWQAGLPLLILTGVIVALGLKEVTDLLVKSGLKPSLLLAQAGGLILLAGAYLYLGGYPGPTITIILFLHLLFVIGLYPRYTLVDMAGTLFGTLYLGLLYYFYLIRTLDDGWIWLIFMFTCTWACDTFAFLVGRAFGKKALAPRLSPRKTVEGALSGILAGGLVAGVFALIYPFLPVGKLVLLGILMGVAAVIGDLLESALKRQAGLKDSGSLIPGHGGILDRFDSVLFTAPLVYYFVFIFIV